MPQTRHLGSNATRYEQRISRKSVIRDDPAMFPGWARPTAPSFSGRVEKVHHGARLSLVRNREHSLDQCCVSQCLPGRHSGGRNRSAVDPQLPLQAHLPRRVSQNGPGTLRSRTRPDLAGSELGRHFMLLFSFGGLRRQQKRVAIRGDRGGLSRGLCALLWLRTRCR